MVASEEGDLVYDVRLSSVGPGRATGNNSAHFPSGVDLAMKLHYLRGVYFLDGQAIEGMSNLKVKESMFYWLIEYFHTCGRFRRSESGRAHINCNDCGVRFIEARCRKTVDEWFEIDGWDSLQDLLLPDQVIGPELSYSPLVLAQITHFKCGGISLGFSLAHILGDAFSAADYINRWAHIATSIQSNGPPEVAPIIPYPINESQNFEVPQSLLKELPHSLKRVDPVGDRWISTNSTQMGTFSFQITPSQISHLKNKTMGPIFESICAIIWQSIAKVRRECEPKIVSLLKRNPKRTKGSIANSQIISTVEADSSPKQANLQTLATLLAEQASDETEEIEEVVTSDQQASDFIVYGAKLTFVDWQEGDFYELELQGQKPNFVWFSVQGVGNNGVVFVLPGAKYFGKLEKRGRLVSVILPLSEISELKCELKKNELLLDTSIE